MSKRRRDIGGELKGKREEEREGGERWRAKGKGTRESGRERMIGRE